MTLGVIYQVTVFQYTVFLVLWLMCHLYKVLFEERVDLLLSKQHNIYIDNYLWIQNFNTTSQYEGYAYKLMHALLLKCFVYMLQKILLNNLLILWTSDLSI